MKILLTLYYTVQGLGLPKLLFGCFKPISVEPFYHVIIVLCSTRRRSHAKFCYENYCYPPSNPSYNYESKEYPSSSNVHRIPPQDIYDYIDIYYGYDTDTGSNHSNNNLSITTDDKFDVIANTSDPENVNIPYSETDCSSVIIPSFVNLVYTGRYAFEDHSWRQSVLCSVSGVLATVSSESSSFFVSLITMDRILAIKYPLSSRRLTKVGGILLAVLAWTISLSLALFPILPMGFSSFEGFYAQTAICIYLPLSVQRRPGWQYSMVVFVGINFIIFLGILVGQCVIVLEVIKSGRKIQSSNRHQREVALAKSVGAVVLTDFFCWIPIGIIDCFFFFFFFFLGMLTFSGVDISSEVYNWILVLVLPINSALNPILYTFSAVLRQRDRRAEV
ncbi:G-protein coupled receptor GRL101-like [Ostrea edulis]|uniref:G-protein coupled receptor GRL101-like n=1 Tax=Ostrea edulis TaxID=37623 RepID=UPI0024AF5536|nr:G-protein coupled receptor GRL101-like [Ostrea edulis]